MMLEQELVTVSISDEKEVQMEKEDNVPDRKESTTSFLNPAINLARRLSMKITGQRGNHALISEF